MSRHSLRRFVQQREADEPRPAAEQPRGLERCELCGAPLQDGHRHAVDVESRALLCTCRACWLLFTQEGRYRSIPDRSLYLADFRLDDAWWDALQIPVNIVFFFRNTKMRRVVALYPGPMGTTESLLGLHAWEQVAAANPILADVSPDVEAVLVRRSGDAFECYLVPIDACYALTGRLRATWRGFDGGDEARRAVEDFFTDLRAHSKPHQEVAP